MAQQELSATAQEAIEIADAQVNNFGLPTYSKLLAALEQIERLGREGSRDGHLIRDAMQEVAAKAIAA